MQRELLLLRHGIAEDLDPERGDASRPLSPRGRARTRAVLQRLRALELTADRLLASPLVRARQTAEIAVEEGLAPVLELAEPLAPGGDPLPLLSLWAGAGHSPEPEAPRRRLLLVGHEPDLGRLAARLIGAPPQAIALRKAGLALLRLPQGPLQEGTASLLLLLPPKVLLI
ncbi:MAG: phosphohistidine phosphatase SixA [Cyanobacteriota bacterium]|jgi:phosphohistidine phosphatase